MKGHGRKDRDDDRLFGHEAEEDRARLAEAGWAEVDGRPGWWRHRDSGVILPEAEALERARGDVS